MSLGTAVRLFVSFPLLFVVPGLLALRLLRPSGYLTRGERVFAAVLTSICLSSWIAISLAELGMFSLRNLLLALGAVSIATGAAIGWRVLRMEQVERGGPHSGTGIGWPRPKPAPATRLALAGILVGAVVLFFQPAESIFGMHDAGLRSNAGVHIATTGGILIQSPELADAADSPDLVQPLGIFAHSPREGIFVHQFNGLYEAWIAVFYSIFGARFGTNPLPVDGPLGILFRFSQVPTFLYVTPTFGWLSVLALYYLGKRVFDSSTGIVAALFLTLSLPQIWYSRLSMSEVLTEFLILGALHAFSLYSERWDPRWGALSAVSLGVAFLTRIDVVFAVALALAFVASASLLGQARRHIAFAAPLALLTAQAVTHYVVFSTGYSLTTVDSLLRMYGWAIPWAVAGLLAVATLAFAAWCSRATLGQRLGKRLMAKSRQARLAAAGVVAIAAFYAYFIRPALWGPRWYYHPLLAQEVPLWHEANLQMLGWYLTPLAILLATVGLVLLLVRGVNRASVALIALGLLHTVVFVHDAYITPHHLFWVRRYLPEVIPFLFLCAAYVLVRPPSVVRDMEIQGRRVGAWLPAVLAVGIAVNLAWISRPAFDIVDYSEGAGLTYRFATQMQRDAVIIFEKSAMSSWLAVPTAGLHQRSSFVLATDTPDSERVAALVDRWRQRGKAVYYVANRGQTTLSTDRFTFKPVGETWFIVGYLEFAIARLPEREEIVQFNADVYELVPTSTRPGVPHTLHLDVGTFDYGYIQDGFYGRKATPSETSRLTGAEAELLVPWNPMSPRVALSLAVAGERPLGVEPAQTRIYVDGVEVGNLAFGNDYDNHETFLVQRVVFPATLVPRAEPGFVRLRFVTNTWVPSRAGLGDIREQGFALDWVRIEPALD